ncbi:hypothetical protein ACFVGY_08060 [Streptomyces sp. NPDC127106]|uniref:hypothetical protein n=1 Tax=Streptomyces sp. NPDC127106 TaxID=3345360 RepID=UPI00363623C9
MSGFRRAAAVLTAGAASTLLAGFAPPAGSATPAGNGIEDESARVIVDRARAELAGARSVHMVAQVQDTTGSTTLDLHLDVNGNCAGSVGLPKGGGSAQIVKRGQDIWVKPNTAFLKSQVPGPAGEDAAALINDRWVHGNAENALLRGLTQVCDLTDFQRKYTAGPASENLTKGGRTTVDGKAAITVTGRDGADTTTYYVATEGEPYLLRVTGVEDGQRGRADFSDYDEPVPAKTPPPEESVDLSELR